MLNMLVIGENRRHGAQLMRFDGHYDEHADIAWLRFAGYDPATAVVENAGYGFRELDIKRRQVVGLQYWQATRNLPAGLLAMLPASESLLVDDDRVSRPAGTARRR